MAANGGIYSRGDEARAAAREIIDRKLSTRDLEKILAERKKEIEDMRLKAAKEALPELAESEDVGKMSAESNETDTASGQIRTDDRRFTKPLLYP